MSGKRSCEQYPDCLPGGFQDGGMTKDGKPTFKPTCAAGSPGGCGKNNLEEILDFDRSSSGGAQPGTPPKMYDGLGRPTGGNWPRGDTGASWKSRGR